ncbi:MULTISPECIES: LysE family translocator [Burkholderia]|uniref:LysE family translocator n=1 Tax=Burkholderia TaxID=32008 RepID=UPI00075DD63E|nr:MULTISPECIES: LysE family translocator [Burkholderia]KVH08924.1 threonine transporter RhtB [Burkholderia anthina]KVH12871.1 threonine transporter RhtB [Burkholderia anthina]KVM84118.1 threonine transporter RhtB [Burkholderia anthina]KVN65441.1 threonine transporter RhtB [Burkholderia anthina]KVX29084.1 threonine transporter RhtB [Burkholderia anthina]
MTLHYPLLFAYLAAIVLLIATPGPVVMLVTGTVARRGFRQGVLTAVGANAASLVMIAGAMLMVFGVVMVSARLLAGLHVAGCLFIAGLAIRTLLGEWRAARERGGDGAAAAEAAAGEPAAGEPVARPRGLPGIVRGFLVGIANPKDLLFFVAFFPQFVAITPDSRVSLAILAALWIAVDFTILTGYMAAINHPAMHRKQRWISASSALALLAIALAGLGSMIAGAA